MQRNPRPVQVLVKYMLDIAMGMHYIAEKGLVHRVSIHMVFSYELVHITIGIFNTRSLQAAAQCKERAT